MNQAEIIRIKEAMDKARNEDTTPFVVPTEDELVVAGDPNKTERKVGNYTIQFRFPKEMTNGMNVVKTIGKYAFVDIDYNDVRITPRHDMEIMKRILRIIPFFNDMKEDGTIDAVDKGDFIALVMGAEDEFMGEIYALVKIIVGVDDELAPYMMPSSVFETFVKLTEDFPEAFNEADSFFGFSTENR